MDDLKSIPFEQIDVADFAERIAAGDDLQLIDVRELQEVGMAALPGFTILPLSEFPTWSSTIHNRLEADKETIVMCHHGVRSAQMCAWLCQQGFSQVKNLIGGIDAYAIYVDPKVPRY